MTHNAEKDAPWTAALLRDLVRYGCHGTVVRDGYDDACGKQVTVIIDGRTTEDGYYWPACTYHGHRYGGGRVVPLAELLGCVVIPPAVTDEATR